MKLIISAAFLTILFQYPIHAGGRQVPYDIPSCTLTKSDLQTIDKVFETVSPDKGRSITVRYTDGVVDHDYSFDALLRTLNDSRKISSINMISSSTETYRALELNLSTFADGDNHVSAQGYDRQWVEETILKLRGLFEAKKTIWFIFYGKSRAILWIIASIILSLLLNHKLGKARKSILKKILQSIPCFLVAGFLIIFISKKFPYISYDFQESAISSGFGNMAYELIKESVIYILGGATILVYGKLKKWTEMTKPNKHH